MIRLLSLFPILPSSFRHFKFLARKDEKSIGEEDERSGFRQEKEEKRTYINIGIIPIQFSESEGDEGEVNEIICLGNQLEQSVMDELESGTSNSKLISSSKQIDEQNETVEFVEEIRAVQSERKQGNKL